MDRHFGIIQVIDLEGITALIELVGELFEYITLSRSVFQIKTVYAAPRLRRLIRNGGAVHGVGVGGDHLMLFPPGRLVRAVEYRSEGIVRVAGYIADSMCRAVVFDKIQGPAHRQGKAEVSRVP